MFGLAYWHGDTRNRTRSLSLAGQVQAGLTPASLAAESRRSPSHGRGRGTVTVTPGRRWRGPGFSGKLNFTATWLTGRRAAVTEYLPAAPGRCQLGSHRDRDSLSASAAPWAAAPEGIVTAGGPGYIPPASSRMQKRRFNVAMAVSPSSCRMAARRPGAGGRRPGRPTPWPQQTVTGTPSAGALSGHGTQPAAQSAGVSDCQPESRHGDPGPAARTLSTEAGQAAASITIQGTAGQVSHVAARARRRGRRRCRARRPPARHSGWPGPGAALQCQTEAALGSRRRPGPPAALPGRLSRCPSHGDRDLAAVTDAGPGPTVRSESLRLTGTARRQALTVRVSGRRPRRPGG